MLRRRDQHDIRVRGPGADEQPPPGGQPLHRVQRVVLVRGGPGPVDAAEGGLGQRRARGHQVQDRPLHAARFGLF